MTKLKGRPTTYDRVVQGKVGPLLAISVGRGCNAGVKPGGSVEGDTDTGRL